MSSYPINPTLGLKMSQLAEVGGGLPKDEKMVQEIIKAGQPMPMPVKLQKELLDPSGLSFMQDSMLEKADQVTILT